MPDHSNPPEAATEKDGTSRPSVVAIATQKGGVGKSTVVMLLASYLHAVRERAVFVADADAPQHTIFQIRASELEKLDRSKPAHDPHFERLFQRYGRAPLYHVIPTPMEGVFAANEGYPPIYDVASDPEDPVDTLLIDMPGSLSSPAYGQIVSRSDRIVVPLEPEEGSLRSTMAFLSTLLSGSDDYAGRIVAFWNKVQWRSHHREVTAYTSGLRDLGVHVLANYIPYSVKLGRSETRSTVLPPDFSALDLEAFMTELAQAVQIPTDVQVA